MEKMACVCLPAEPAEPEHGHMPRTAWYKPTDCSADFHFCRTNVELNHECPNNSQRSVVRTTLADRNLVWQFYRIVTKNHIYVPFSKTVFQPKPAAQWFTPQRRSVFLYSYFLLTWHIHLASKSENVRVWNDSFRPAWTFVCAKRKQSNFTKKWFKPEQSS